MWWSVARFLSPIAGRIAGQPKVAIWAAALLLLPSLLLFDTAGRVASLSRDLARIWASRGLEDEVRLPIVSSIPLDERPRSPVLHDSY